MNNIQIPSDEAIHASMKLIHVLNIKPDLREETCDEYRQQNILSAVRQHASQLREAVNDLHLACPFMMTECVYNWFISGVNGIENACERYVNQLNEFNTSARQHENAENENNDIRYRSTVSHIECLYVEIECEHRRMRKKHIFIQPLENITEYNYAIINHLIDEIDKFDFQTTDINKSQPTIGESISVAHKACSLCQNIITAISVLYNNENRICTSSFDPFQRECVYEHINKLRSYCINYRKSLPRIKRSITNTLRTVNGQESKQLQRETNGHCCKLIMSNIRAFTYGFADMIHTIISIVET